MSCRCRRQLAACSTLRRVRSTARFSSAPLRTLCTPRLTHASRCRRARPTGSHSFTYVASHALHCTTLKPTCAAAFQCSAVQYECAVASLTCACVGRPQGHASRTSLAAAAAAGGESHRSELAAAAFDTLSEEGGGDADTMPLLTGSLDGRIVLLDVEAKRPLLVTQVKVTRLDSTLLYTVL